MWSVMVKMLCLVGRDRKQTGFKNLFSPKQNSTVFRGL